MKFFTCTVLLALSIAAPAWSQSRDATAEGYVELRRQVIEKSKQLREIVGSEADLQKGPNDALLALSVADLFLMGAEWDFQHPLELAQVIGAWKPAADSADSIAHELPLRELRDCLAILNDALDRVNSARSAKYRSAVDLTSTSCRIENGYYRTDGRIVFPYSILWLPLAADRTFSQFENSYLHPAFLHSSKPRISQGQRDWYRSQLDEIGSANRAAYLFLGHVMPDWALQSTPELARGSTRFVEYDIDHPAAESSWKELFSTMGSEFRGHPAALKNCLLANEPHWFFSECGWGTSIWSDRTQSRFRKWLQSEHGTIEALNRRYKTHFRDFDEISVDLPISIKLQGTASWYDMSRFNMFRVRAWFAIVIETIESLDSEIQTHIKLPASLLLDTPHTHGIDWYGLGRQQGILGIDCTTTSRGGISDSFAELSPTRPYSIDWVGSLFALDFLRSIEPNKLIFDSEWHGVSNIHWRNPDLDPAYLRVGLYLHHVSGMGMIQVWYWGREADGHPIERNQDEFFGSLATQPRILNEFVRTMLQLNLHADAIACFGGGLRQIGLFYSEDAAICDPQYLPQLSAIYQSLKFLGLGVRIVPCEDLGQAAESIKVLVVPPTRYIQDSHLSQLKTVSQTIKLLLVGDEQFQYGVYGEPLVSDGDMWWQAFPKVSPGSPEQMFGGFCSELADQLRDAAVVGETGEPVFGLLQWTSEAAGQTRVFLANVGTSEMHCRLRLSGSVREILSGTKLESSQLVIEPLGIRLFEVSVTPER